MSTREAATLDLEPYAQWLSVQGLSASTIKQRIGFAEGRHRAWGRFDVPDHRVTEWLAEHDGWTRCTYFHHLRSLYSWLEETGAVTINPVQRYRSPKAPDGRANPLTDAQVDRVLEAASGHVRTWLLLGLLAGLRSHEIAKVRGEDVTENQLFVLGKGGRATSLPTHPLLWETALTYPRTGYWFPSVQQRRDHVSESHVSHSIRALFRDQGIEKGSIHRCRHTYGTGLARAGVQPRVIQDLLRHSSLQTTMNYLAVSDPERAAAVRKLGASW